MLSAEQLAKALEARIERQRNQCGDMLYVGQPDAIDVALLEFVRGQIEPAPEEKRVSRFRAIGFDHEAENWEHTQYGLAIIAQHNGVSVDQLPPLMRHASNRYMHQWLDLLGQLQSKGMTVRDPDGRWYSMAKLLEVYG